MQELFETTGRYETPNAGKYLIQLCKHFGHKVPAAVDGDEGRISFDMGEALLRSDDEAVTVILKAASEGAALRLQAVIDDHLKRFAFREAFDGMTWTTPAV